MIDKPRTINDIRNDKILKINLLFKALENIKNDLIEEEKINLDLTKNFEDTFKDLKDQIEEIQAINFVLNHTQGETKK